MGKTFRYTRITSRAYDSYRDRAEEDGVEFEYEVEKRDLLPHLVDLMFDDYFGDDKVVVGDKNLTQSVKGKLRTLIEEQDLVYMLANNYEDQLKEIFRDEAKDFCMD